MTCLINLLSWNPGYSGFDTYVKRVVPGIDGLRLQLSDNGEPLLIHKNAWFPQTPPWASSRRIRLLQRYCLVQHGFDLNTFWVEQSMAKDSPDLIYSPFFECLLCWPKVPQLITCHDLTPLVAPTSRRKWMRYRFWQPYHCFTARKIIAISLHVADQLLAYGVPSSKVCVIPNGIELHRTPINSPVSEDLLAIARHDVNKNLPALFRGVALMQRRWPQWKGQMRIIGRSGRQTPLLYKLLNQLPRPEQVHLIEEVSQEQLVSLMRSSMALVSSSTEEGFNYPVLEAKAEGLPTLISDIPLHRELHHDSSLFFPTNDDGSCFSDQLRQLITDQNLWRHLSVQGVFLAKKMSIQHQKDSIRDLCAELIG